MEGTVFDLVMEDSGKCYCTVVTSYVDAGRCL